MTRRIRAQAATVASVAVICLAAFACRGSGSTSSPASATATSGFQPAPASATPARSTTPAKSASMAPGGCAASSPPVVGVKVDQYNTGWLDQRTYTYEGFDVKVAEWASQTLFGVKNPDFLPVSSDTRAPALASCAIRYFVATYTILPSRQRQFAIAGPYLVTYQGVMLGPHSPDITNVSQLVGKRVCVVGGGSQAKSVLVKFVPGAIPEPVDAYSTCLQQLQRGNVAAFSTDLAILYGYLQEPGSSYGYANELGASGFRVVKGLIIGDPIFYGIAFRWPDKKLCEETKNALETWTQSLDWSNDLQQYLDNYYNDQSLYPESLQPTLQEIDANSCVKPPPASLSGPTARSSANTPEKPSGPGPSVRRRLGVLDGEARPDSPRPRRRESRSRSA